MGASTSTGSGGNFRYLKFAQDRDKTSETFKQSFFHYLEKRDGKYQPGTPHNAYEGKLVNIEFTSYEWEKKMIPTMALTFKDETTGTYEKVEMHFNILTRGIMNSLCTDPDFICKNTIFFRTYVSAKGHGSILISRKPDFQDRDAWIGWKFQIKDIPEVVVHEVGNKKITDDTLVNQFFTKWLKHEYKGKLEGVAEAEAKASASTGPDTDNHESAPSHEPVSKGVGLPPEGDDDDLPF